MVGGFALGLILGVSIGAALYREAYEFFRQQDEKRRRFEDHLQRVHEFEEKGRVDARII